MCKKLIVCSSLCMTYTEVKGWWTKTKMKMFWDVIYCADQAGLKLIILLAQVINQCWDFKHVSFTLALIYPLEHNIPKNVLTFKSAFRHCYREILGMSGLGYQIIMLTNPRQTEEPVCFEVHLILTRSSKQLQRRVLIFPETVLKHSPFRMFETGRIHRQPSST